MKTSIHECWNKSTSEMTKLQSFQRQIDDRILLIFTQGTYKILLMWYRVNYFYDFT